jgi:Kyakuja-Dileera-Zisupton transposase
MDYAVCNALQYKSDGLTRAIVIYDIACQFFRNFFTRVPQYGSLQLQDWQELIPCVGKWHLSAHIPSCFTRHSLNFVKGAGQQDGEILETLWAEFNKVSVAARTMSKAHRSEVYDDHMRDWNWQKIVGMGNRHHISSIQSI